MAKGFGIMLVRKYEQIVDEFYTEALRKARAQVNAQKVEEKAWEILGRPDIYKKRRQKELELEKIENEEMKYMLGSCNGEDSDYERAKKEAEAEIDKLAWEEIGHPELYEQEVKLRKEQARLEKELQKLKEAQAPYKTADTYYRTTDTYYKNRSDKLFDKAFQKYATTTTERTWAKLGKPNLLEQKDKVREALNKISDEEKPFNGNVCEMKRQITREYFNRSVPMSHTTPLEEARWQAKELLYPAETELEELRRNTKREIIRSGLSEEVGGIIGDMEQKIEGLLK
jgi:hypothetical protein